MRLPIVQTSAPRAATATFDTGPRSIAAVRVLRISVTDKCNFRCLYCMPEEGLQWLPKSEILSYEEIADVVRQVQPLGVTRLRITGGEPLIRPNLDRLIVQLKAIPGIEDISLST